MLTFLSAQEPRPAAAQEAAPAPAKKASSDTVTVSLSLRAVKGSDSDCPQLLENGSQLKVTMTQRGHKVLLGRNRSQSDVAADDPHGYVEIHCQFLSTEHLAMWTEENDLDPGSPYEGVKWGVCVADLGSLNGTRLNRSRLRADRKEPIFVGDSLRFADRVIATVDDISPLPVISTRKLYKAATAAAKARKIMCGPAAGAPANSTRAATKLTGLMTLEWSKDLSSTSPVTVSSGKEKKAVSSDNKKSATKVKSRRKSSTSDSPAPARMSRWQKNMQGTIQVDDLVWVRGAENGGALPSAVRPRCCQCYRCCHLIHKHSDFFSVRRLSFQPKAAALCAAQTMQDSHMGLATSLRQLLKR